MNKDVFEGKWKQIRSEAKGWWGKLVQEMRLDASWQLTDDDLERAGGKYDVFTGMLQEK